MAYRRKLIDRRTRAGKAVGNWLDAAKGLGILALIAAFFASGHDHTTKPPGDSKGSPATETQLKLSDDSATRRTASVGWQQPSGSLSAVSAAEATNAAASTTFAMNAVTAQPPASRADTGTVGQVVPWRHVTEAGVRWSLRNVNSTSMLLIVDLGGGQVANVSVAPAFEDLNLASINDRVNYIRSIATQLHSGQTANYIFNRDGVLRPLP